MTGSDIQQSDASASGKKIRGWLLIWAIFLPILLVGEIWGLAEFSSRVTFARIWTMLFDKSSKLYDPNTAISLFGGLVYYIVFFSFSVYLTILFFRKQRIFPKILIGYLLLKFLALFIAMIWIYAVPLWNGMHINFFSDQLRQACENPMSPECVNVFDWILASPLVSFLRSILEAAIWIPYFLYSTRVKDTFVRSGW